MVEGGWRDVCSGVLLAEMGAPKSRLMKVKEESEKGEKEGKGKKEREREGGKGCIWTPPLGLVIAGGSSRLCALISKFTFQPPLGGGKEESFF